MKPDNHIEPVKNNTVLDHLLLSVDPEDFCSQEVQDIISECLGFWGIWALPMLLIIPLLIAAGIWFIHYPDTIMVTAMLTATNGPGKSFPAPGREINEFVCAQWRCCYTRGTNRLDTKHGGTCNRIKTILLTGLRTRFDE